eukprot:Rhum_TRINITY_DN14477_c1_g1::Rhum_TRINITY_DN14477_c1_g1_i3::g.90255::m.90255
MFRWYFGVCVFFLFLFSFAFSFKLCAVFFPWGYCFPLFFLCILLCIQQRTTEACRPTGRHGHSTQPSVVCHQLTLSSLLSLLSLRTLHPSLMRHACKNTYAPYVSRTRAFFLFSFFLPTPPSSTPSIRPAHQTLRLLRLAERLDLRHKPLPEHRQLLQAPLRPPQRLLRLRLRQRHRAVARVRLAGVAARRLGHEALDQLLQRLRVRDRCAVHLLVQHLQVAQQRHAELRRLPHLRLLRRQARRRRGHPRRRRRRRRRQRLGGAAAKAQDVVVVEERDVVLLHACPDAAARRHGRRARAAQLGDLALQLGELAAQVGRRLVRRRRVCELLLEFGVEAVQHFDFFGMPAVGGLLLG